MRKESKIIVALDFPSYQEAVGMAIKLDPDLCHVKVGMELFTNSGPSVVEELINRGFEVFLDLKFFDIPNTVAGAVRSACGLGVSMLTLHCLGTKKMMEAAANEAAKHKYQPILLGVTILTSMEFSDLEEVGIMNGGTEVSRLANLAFNSGLDGVVCSGQEVNYVSNMFRSDDNFILVTPGIRLPEGSKDDQARIVTPEKAIHDGADYIVVGRPITSAPDPLAMLMKFQDRIDNNG